MEDIVDLLKRHGYGVVEGKEPVLAKIDEISQLERIMEEMAGEPNTWGDRTPGERCAYEIPAEDRVTLAARCREDASDSKE